MFPNVEVRHLRAVALGEELNFTKAALRLHLTQSALSRFLWQNHSMLISAAPGALLWPAAMIVWGPGYVSSGHKHHCVQLVMAMTVYFVPLQAVTG